MPPPGLCSASHVTILVCLRHSSIRLNNEFANALRLRMLIALNAIANRLRAYNSSIISTEIDDQDIMFVRGVSGAEDHYFSVGRSAIDVIAKAMVATKKTAFRKVVDLPCGGGR